MLTAMSPLLHRRSPTSEHGLSPDPHTISHDEPTPYRLVLTHPQHHARLEIGTYGAHNGVAGDRVVESLKELGSARVQTLLVPSHQGKTPRHTSDACGCPVSSSRSRRSNQSERNHRTTAMSRKNSPTKCVPCVRIPKDAPLRNAQFGSP